MKYRQLLMPTLDKIIAKTNCTINITDTENLLTVRIVGNGFVTSVKSTDCLVILSSLNKYLNYLG